MFVNSQVMESGFGSLPYVPPSLLPPLTSRISTCEFYRANEQRSDVPISVTRDASSIDISLLGTPDAEYLSSGCDINSAFTGMSPRVLSVLYPLECSAMMRWRGANQ